MATVTAKKQNGHTRAIVDECRIQLPDAVLHHIWAGVVAAFNTSQYGLSTKQFLEHLHIPRTSILVDARVLPVTGHWYYELQYANRLVGSTRALQSRLSALVDMLEWREDDGKEVIFRLDTHPLPNLASRGLDDLIASNRPGRAQLLAYLQIMWEWELRQDGGQLNNIVVATSAPEIDSWLESRIDKRSDVLGRIHEALHAKN